MSETAFYEWLCQQQSFPAVVPPGMQITYDRRMNANGYLINNIYVEPYVDSNLFVIGYVQFRYEDTFHRTNGAAICWKDSGRHFFYGIRGPFI
jgi:hypothetical protein